VEPRERRIAVLADDLIWASRLVAAVERGGATPVPARSRSDLERILGAPVGIGVEAALIDLNGRRYDGVEAIAVCAQAGLPVVAVGQHEDLALRQTALAAGATKVYPYNKLFRDGPQVVSSLLREVDATSLPVTPG
jgi:CheY-like chemotaxis protein